MGDVEPKQPEQPEEPEPKEAEQEGEKPAEEAEPEEGEEAAEESGEEPEGEEAKGAEAKDGDANEQGSDAEEHDRRRPRNGWKRRNEKLEYENAILREQLMRGQGQASNGKPDKEKTPQEQAAEYVRSLVRQEREQYEAERAQQARVAEFQRRTAEVRASQQDFDAVMDSAGDMRISPALEQVLLTSEHGPSIMYQLAKSPAELERLSALPPLDAAREIGKLEAKLASSAAPAKTTKPALRPPVPPTSVNGKAPSTRDLDSLPIGEYKRAYRSGRR